MERRAVLLGLLASALIGSADPADARSGGKRRRRRRARGLPGASGGFHDREATSSGECPCNGGKVCTGKRGGRYCITSSGRKRYGV